MMKYFCDKCKEEIALPYIVELTCYGKLMLCKKHWNELANWLGVENDTAN